MGAGMGMDDTLDAERRAGRRIYIIYIAGCPKCNARSAEGQPALCPRNSRGVRSAPFVAQMPNPPTKWVIAKAQGRELAE
eukprot:15433177-Alexandrium_andersonii.AAC.1